MKLKIWWPAALCGAMLALGLASAVQAQQAGSAGLSPQAQDKHVEAITARKDALAPAAQPLPSPDQYANNPVAQAKMKQIEVCTACHDETDPKPILAYFQINHGALGDPRTPVCQDCHGESKNHLGGAQHPDGKRPPPDRVLGRGHTTTAGYEPLSAPEQSEVCLSCHKGSLRMRWPGSQHQSNDITCTNCHTNHSPKDAVRERDTQTTVCFTCHKEKRAEFSKISHMPIETGKVVCSDCHNPHGSGGPSLLVKNSVNETCFQCHADKRGPFLWEHQPATEACTNCHNPHGSNITPLLKERMPFLCDSCHNGPHNSAPAVGAGAAGIQGGGVPIAGSTLPGGAVAAATAPSQFYVGRACLNCHVQVHGSNSPAGAFLHR